jgi:hypothetical protein
MTRRKNRPSTPEEVRAKMKARAELDSDLALLARRPGVEVELEPNGKIRRAQYLDFASLLLRREAISVPAFDAYRMTQELHATASGAFMGGGGLDRVDCSTQGAPGQNVTQAMIDASKRLDWLFGQIGIGPARLIRALMEQPGGNGPGGCGQWHTTVERVTGEANEDTHAALVRSACEGLAEAFRASGYRRAA